MTLGEKIKELRKERKISQPQLAKMTGISQQLISKFELGLTQKPPMESLQKIGIALEINPKILFELAGYPTSPETSNDVILRELEEIDVKLRDIMARLRQ